MLDTIIVGVDGGPGGRDALALARRLHGDEDDRLMLRTRSRSVWTRRARG